MITLKQIQGSKKKTTKKEKYNELWQSTEIKKFAFLSSVLQFNSHFDVILTDVFETY